MSQGLRNEDRKMKFSDIAIKKLDTLIERGYKITSIQITPPIVIRIKKDDEIGTIDQFGRVTWNDP